MDSLETRVNKYINNELLNFNNIETNPLEGRFQYLRHPAVRVGLRADPGSWRTGGPLSDCSTWAWTPGGAAHTCDAVFLIWKLLPRPLRPLLPP